MPKHTDEQMLAAIRRVVAESGGDTSVRTYAAQRLGSEPAWRTIAYRFGTWDKAVASAGVASNPDVARTVQPPRSGQHDDGVRAVTVPVLPTNKDDEALIAGLMAKAARAHNAAPHNPAAQRAAFVGAMDAGAAKAPAYPPRITASEPRDPVEAADARDKHSRLKSAHDDLVNRLREERKRNEFILSMRDVKTPTILRAEKTSGLREMTAVAMLSDAHVEEIVEPHKVGYRNEYNLEIAHRSLARFKQAIIDLVEHHRADKKTVIRDVVLAFSGDLMTGHIHDELVETAQLSPVETALWLKPRLGDIIRGLLDELDLRSVVVPYSYGNHGRTTPKRRIATGAEHSYEWLLGRMLESDFANDPRVKWDTSPWAHQYAVVYDQTLHWTHGDEVNFGGGVGGLAIPLMKRIPKWDELRYAHVHHCGHFHQLRSFGRGKVNGSVIGYNQFAIAIGASYEPPQQLFYLLDSKRGVCHETPLWVRGDDEVSRAA
jgi:hypothetical protein